MTIPSFLDDRRTVPYPTDTAEVLHFLGSSDPREQKSAATELQRRAAGDPTIRPAIVAALRSPDRRLRWGAAYTLSLMGSNIHEALNVLAENLDSEDRDVRWAAASILSRCEARSEVDRLLKRLLTGGTPMQRRMALYSLQESAFTWEEFDPIVDSAIKDPDPGVRLAAMSLMARSETSKLRWAERLSERLFDTEVALRRAAAAHIARLVVATPSVREKLESLRDDRDPILRRVVRKALLKLAEHQSTDP